MKKLITVFIYSYWLVASALMLNDRNMTTAIATPQMEQIETAPVEVKVLTRQENIYDVAERVYGVDATLLMAIEAQESGWHSSALYKNQFNSWGSYNSSTGGWNSFYNSEDATLELARTLKTHYYDKGYTTIDEISVKYCPPTSEEWAAAVKSIMERIDQGSTAWKDI